jgi:hypothetical protein
MKLAILVLTAAFALMGCSKTSTNPVITTLNSVGCDAETELSTSFGTALASVTGATSAPACSAALQIALGNANYCSIQIPQAAASATPAVALKEATVRYSTIGSIPGSALHGGGNQPHFTAKDALLGTVGAIACPVADSAILGLLTGAIPAACQGKTALTGTAANQALVAACETLFGAL